MVEASRHSQIGEDDSSPSGHRLKERITWNWKEQCESGLAAAVDIASLSSQQNLMER